MRKLYIYFILIAFLTSCGSIKKMELEAFVEQNNCNQQNDYTYTKDSLPNPLHTLNLDTSLTNKFSEESLNLANAIGLIDMLEEYILKVEHKSNIEDEVELLQLRQKINQRINLASIEISAVASEIDCEEERIEQIANFIRNKEDKLETNLTVGAIVTGAVGAILSAVIFINDPDDNSVEYVGISTGLTEVLFGTLLLTNNKKVYISHDRNILRDLWEGNEVSNVFPPSIWYYLNYHNPDDEYSISVREQILEKWMKFGQITDSKENKRKKLINLYFKEGGKYTTEQLFNRSNMHDQVEAQINLMKQDLKMLGLELEKF